MVHSRDRRLQRVHQGKAGWIINITAIQMETAQTGRSYSDLHSAISADLG